MTWKYALIQYGEECLGILYHMTKEEAETELKSLVLPD